MRVLDFIASGQSLTRDPACDFSGVVSNTRGYLFARFQFSDDWKGCKKVAVFSCCGNDFPAPVVNNMCEIPADALTTNAVLVTVVGQRDRYRITTNTIGFQQSVGR